MALLGVSSDKTDATRRRTPGNEATALSQKGDRTGMAQSRALPSISKAHPARELNSSEARHEVGKQTATTLRAWWPPAHQT